jgi:hypothetical protein
MLKPAGLDRPSGCGSLTGDGGAGDDSSAQTSQRQTSRRVLKRKTAQQMQGLMRAVIRSGTGRSASLGGQEGGKTGTTNDGRDLLFIGYEPSRHWVLGIWLGNDDNSPSASSSALSSLSLESHHACCWSGRCGGPMKGSNRLILLGAAGLIVLLVLGLVLQAIRNLLWDLSYILPPWLVGPVLLIGTILVIALVVRVGWPVVEGMEKPSRRYKNHHDCAFSPGVASSGS